MLFRCSVLEVFSLGTRELVSQRSKMATVETTFPSDESEVRSISSGSGGGGGGMRFSVEAVAESPTKSMPGVGSIGSQEGNALSIGAAANRTVGTIGYSTAEPVPMTMYYRHEDSKTGAKTRPTLHELHHDTADNEVKLLPLTSARFLFVSVVPAKKFQFSA